MAQQNKEFFAVYIGGPCSMQIQTIWTTGTAETIPVWLGASGALRYVCSRVIELPCPDRLVGVYGYADECQSVRTEIFRVVAVLSFLIRSMGDVHVAMMRFAEIQKDAEFAMDTSFGLELMETVARQWSKSKLQQRIVSKQNNQTLLKGGAQ